MNPTKVKTASELSSEEKIDMIFKYIFNTSNPDDDSFWNILSETEREEINCIRQKDEKISFAEMKKRCLK